jgi:hypothetical protein
MMMVKHSSLLFFTIMVMMRAWGMPSRIDLDAAANVLDQNHQDQEIPRVEVPERFMDPPEPQVRQNRWFDRYELDNQADLAHRTAIQAISEDDTAGIIASYLDHRFVESMMMRSDLRALACACGISACMASCLPMAFVRAELETGSAAMVLGYPSCTCPLVDSPHTLVWLGFLGAFLLVKLAPATVHIALPRLRNMRRYRDTKHALRSRLEYHFGAPFVADLDARVSVGDRWQIRDVFHVLTQHDLHDVALHVRRRHVGFANRLD